MSETLQGFLVLAFSICAVLLFASMSGFVSERAGVVNIAIEGMMTIGALITAILGTLFKNNHYQFLAIIVGALATGIFAMLHAFPSITLKANQIISGTAINLVAAGVGLFFATSGFFGSEPTRILLNFTPIDIAKVIPLWLVLAVVMAVILFIFFRFTKQGMRYAMVGENPNAVDAAGINVNRYRYIAVFMSGIFAGLAGGAFVLTEIGNSSFTGSVDGYGFLALAIMIFGQWRIVYISLGVGIFSFLFALGNQIGILQPQVGAYSKIFQIMPFVLTIVTMILFSKTSRAPAADGIPFNKAKR